MTQSSLKRPSAPLEASNSADLAVELPLDDPGCPLKPTLSPRRVAGPLEENVFKCHLKPLHDAHPDYGNAVFTVAQRARLSAVFSSGVCDWSKHGVGQSDAIGLTFSDGPGGVPLISPAHGAH
jgi:hypothetical protein